MFASQRFSLRVDYCGDDYQMEEQTVPSAGFSPQPEYMTGGGADSSSYYGNGVVHLQPPQPQMHQHNNNHQQQQQHQQQAHHPAPASTQLNAASACYDYNTSFDNFDLSLLGDSYEDRDMATVPSPSASWSPLEPNTWPQMSFYAASPPEFRAFSPECKPFNAAAAVTSNSPSDNQQKQSQQCNNAATPQPRIPMDTSNNAALSNNNNISDDASLGQHQHHQQQQNSNSSATDILLRQCLEDNTFIEKYNFKPLDLPITALPSSNEAVVDSNMENGNNGGARVPTGPTDAVGSAALDMNLEPVFSLAFETIFSDIQNQCRTLGISPDPMQWSVENVHSWLSHSLTSFSGAEKRSGSDSGASVLRSLWNIDGQRLCALSEQEFRQRDPVNGEKIYANLELLKMWKCTPGTGSGSNSAGAGSSVVQPFDFVGQLLSSCSPASSVGAASPAPSYVQDEQPSPAVCQGVTIKVELDHNMQPITPLSQAKFSNPSSVDTASSSVRNSDDDDDEEDEEDKHSAVTAAAATVTKSGKASGTKNGAHIHLWQFLKELLASGQQHGSCIRWLDQGRGVFKIEDSVRVARLWGIRKNRPAMNYDKLSRSIRQYYRKGIMRKTERSQRLVYQFCHPYGL